MWVEVNFTVSAYDELKMCKSRTQAIDPAEYLKDPTIMMDSNLIISKYEVCTAPQLTIEFHLNDSI